MRVESGHASKSNDPKHCFYLLISNETLFRRLSEMPTGLVWKYSDSILEQDQGLGVKVFTRHKDGDKEEFIERTLNILRNIYQEKMSG